MSWCPMVANYGFTMSSCPTMLARAKMTPVVVVRMTLIVAREILAMCPYPADAACAVMLAIAVM